jgi:hypothetical protein
MRCSACSHQWHLMPQAEPELPSTPPTAAPVTSPKPQPEMEPGDDDGLVAYDEIDQVPDPEPIPGVFISSENLNQSEQKLGTRLILPVTAAVIVAGVIAGFVFAKNAIISIFPNLAPVYDVIGMGQPPVGQGLEFGAIQTERNWQANVDVAVVSGTIVNKTNYAIAVPHIQVILSGSSTGVPLKDLVVAPQQLEIAGGENFRFSARVENPPQLARWIDITFTNPPAISNDDMPASPFGH